MSFKRDPTRVRFTRKTHNHVGMDHLRTERATGNVFSLGGAGDTCFRGERLYKLNK